MNNPAHTQTDRQAKKKT